MVKHIMSDGSIRDSIEGIVIPPDNMVYQIITSFLTRVQKEDVKKEAENEKEVCSNSCYMNYHADTGDRYVC